jgi:hypothetical protein
MTVTYVAIKTSTEYVTEVPNNVQTFNCAEQINNLTAFTILQHARHMNYKGSHWKNFHSHPNTIINFVHKTAPGDCSFQFAYFFINQRTTDWWKNMQFHQQLITPKLKHKQWSNTGIIIVMTTSRLSCTVSRTYSLKMTWFFKVQGIYFHSFVIIICNKPVWEKYFSSGAIHFTLMTYIFRTPSLSLLSNSRKVRSCNK